MVGTLRYSDATSNADRCSDVIDHGPRPTLVLECMPMDLGKCLGGNPLEPCAIKVFMLHLISGLEEMHRLNVAHRCGPMQTCARASCQLIGSHLGSEHTGDPNREDEQSRTH
jgi:hypothetical protein